MSYMWARSLSDPKNPFFLRRDVVARTASRMLVNANVFVQEAARLGWRYVFGAEADSIQQFLKNYAAAFDPDFEDAAFQSVWSIMLEVMIDWQMPISLVYRPAGDFVMTANSPVDIYGVPIDPAGFAYEVHARVREKYGDKKYPDVKKVVLTETDIRFAGDVDEEVVGQRLLSIADRLGLQTVPFILRGKEDSYVLYVPQVKGWKIDEKVDPRQIVEELKREGAVVASIHCSGSTVLRRLGIYQKKDGDRTIYRYSNFELGGDWSRFQKTLTITAAYGMLEAAVNRMFGAYCDRFKDEMSTDVEHAKERHFPGKAGFVAHRSMATDARNISAAIDRSVEYFRSTASYVDRSAFVDIEQRTEEVLAGPDGDGYREFFGRLHSFGIKTMSEWLKALSRSSSRLASSNGAMRRMVEGTIDVPQIVAARASQLNGERDGSIALIGEINQALRLVHGLAQKYETFNPDDVTTAKITLGYIKGKIAEFRTRGYAGPSGTGGEGGGEGGQGAIVFGPGRGAGPANAPAAMPAASSALAFNGWVPTAVGTTRFSVPTMPMMSPSTGLGASGMGTMHVAGQFFMGMQPIGLQAAYL